MFSVTTQARNAVVGLAAAGTLALAALGVATLDSPDPAPAPTPVAARPSPTPDVPAILVLVEPEIDRRWHVARAAAELNAATGCQLFTTRDDGREHELLVIHERKRIVDEGWTLRGEYLPAARNGGVASIELSPNTPLGVSDVVARHELLHSVGLEHDHDPTGLMNVDKLGNDRVVADTVTGPDDAEIARVRQLQSGRCTP